jgi:hypothetical protein
MKSPKQIIEAISEYHERIEVVAQDFNSGKNQFSKIDPYELATLLGEEPEDFASRTHCENRISIEILEFDDVCLAGSSASNWKRDDRESKCLIHVAATRTKNSLKITAPGSISPLFGG